jgi:hypothetical protein
MTDSTTTPTVTLRASTAGRSDSESGRRQATVERLIQLALEGLPAMFDRERQLFCYTRKRVAAGLEQAGISERYTMMTLLGLFRHEQAGGAGPLATGPIWEALLADLGWVADVGDLGVLLWLCAVAAPDRLRTLVPRLPVASALSRYAAVGRGVTMELAWFLTGLSYWAQAVPGERAGLEGLARQTYEILRRNQGLRAGGEAGFFGHLATGGSLAGRLRGRIGSFADQVYPIYAMSLFGQVFGDDDAQRRAMGCARGICEEQGPMGQWWWHYDAAGGRVVDGYPVFSVHQHAMAPMTLLALGEATGEDFWPAVDRGLAWINRGNELGYEMEDASAHLVWRCIERSRMPVGRYVKSALGHYQTQVQEPNGEGLQVLFECRPYELGWLLYAFAGRVGAESRRDGRR